MPDNIDPICHMTVNKETAAASFQHEDQTYYFCSKFCLEKFKSQLAAGSAGVPPASDNSLSSKTLYICPMDPEIVAQTAGICPLCGMALEATVSNTSSEFDHELKDMTKRFLVALPLSCIILLLSMIPMHVDISNLFHWNIYSFNLISASFQAAFTTIILLWCSYPFLDRAWLSLKHKSMNMFTLIVLGTSVSYLYSCYNAMSAFFTKSPKFNLYFESAAVITTLVLLGQIVELGARKQTNKAIQALMNLVPKTARKIDKDGQESEISIELIQKGDHIRVKENEKIPVDGIILEGESSIDQSLMTGESQPVFKQKNDRVIAGTLNEAGTFIMRTESIGSDTMLSRIISLTAQAQHSRAPVQRLADMISAAFVPCVLIISIITFIIWSVFVPAPLHIHALPCAIAVLIIACPCALGLATPMSIKIAIGIGAKSGILIKDASSLEVLNKVDTLAIDKTGTLTAGKPKLVNLFCLEQFDRDQVLQMACALEQASNHPLASAFSNINNTYKVESFKAIAGQGIIGKVNGKNILLGNESLLSTNGIMPGSLAKQAKPAYDAGNTIIFVAIDNKAIGFIEITDPINPSVEETIFQLKQMGIQTIMLTGDHKAAAERVAKQLKIDQFESNLLPEEKAKVISDLQNKGHIVAMVGDGVNDAIALASANVGIAMGTGSDVATQGAGITLAYGEMHGITRSIKLSRLTMNNIRQNLFLAFIYNTFGILIATGIFYPYSGILLNPMIASIAMTLSSLSVIANSLRLNKARL